MRKSEDSISNLNERVKDVLSKMTLEEKISFLPSSHPAIERLNIPKFNIGGEGAHGLVVRAENSATVFPQTLGLSMTWNKALIKKIGGIIGDEARVYYKYKFDRSGMLNLFFPTIDMERDPRWGRNEEAYGEDPFLAGKLSVEMIKGVQGGHDYYLKTAATPKHFYANNYEYERTYIDSVIEDERLKFEYYLRVFAYAFEEGRASSLMAAYNKINGIPGMLNPEMNSIVRGKWGADGFFVCDGNAFSFLVSEHKFFETYAECAAAAIKAGINCFLDKAELVTESVTEAHKLGLLTEAEIDDAISKQLRVLFRLGVYGGREGNPYENIPESELCSEESAKIAEQAASEAVVLLKNDGFLPLNQSIGKIAVVGQLTDENFPDWYSGNPPYKITPLDGIKSAFPNSEIMHSDGCDAAVLYSESDKAWLKVSDDGSVSFDGTELTRSTFKVWDWGYNGFGFQNLETGKYLTTTEDGEVRCDAASMWGWFVYELFFLENGIARNGRFVHEKPREENKADRVYDKLYNDGAIEKVNEILTKITVQVVKDGMKEAVDAAKDADAVIVVIGNHPLIGARECVDRKTIDLPTRCARLFENVRAVNENVVLSIIAGYSYAIEEQEKASRAVIFTTHGEQAVGKAIGETLSGKNNPAGRLSMTWYKSDDDLPDINDYDIVKNKMTYLYCDRPVLHEFGFGMSYTKFEYSDLILNEKDGGVTVEFSVKNIGAFDGDEVVQVYYSVVNSPIKRPIKQLEGFERIRLSKNEMRHVKLDIPRKELEYYNTEKGAFDFIGGEYKFSVGASSADFRLEKVMNIKKG